MSKLKIVCLALWSILLAASISWADQPAAETMIIETYYPAPYGSYNELQLYPKSSTQASSCTSDDERGLLYYDDAGTTLSASDDKVMVCKGTDGWKELGHWQY